MAGAVVSSAHRFEEPEPMPTSFRKCRDDEFMLLLVDMRDWLPERHLAYLIRDMVREIDLSPFYQPYAGDGRRNRPYEPRMMVSVLIHAYATGVFLVAPDCAQAAQGCGLPHALRRFVLPSPDDLRVPSASSRRLPAPVP